MALVSHLPPLKRESQSFLSSKTHSLECQDRVPSHRVEDFSYTKPSNMSFIVKN